MNRKIGLIGVLALLALIACGCRAQTGHPNYIIKILYGTSHVVTLETSTGETRRADEPLDRIEPDGQCMKPHSWVRAKGGLDTLLVTWKGIPEVSALIPLAAKEIPSDAPVWLRTGPFGTCHPEAGVQAVGGYVYWQPPRGAPKAVIQFYCVYDNRTKETVFVDFEVFEDGGTYATPSYRTFFDARGGYFYYIMKGTAKRFSVAEEQIDTITAGEHPMIPWNEHATIVYSESDREYRLLDDRLAVIGSIAGDLEGSVMSVYMLDETTFVFACEYVFSPDEVFGVDATSSLAFFELDFRRKAVRELSRGRLSTTGDILSVERVD